MKVWIVFSKYTEDSEPKMEVIYDSEDKADAEVAYYRGSHKYFHYANFYSEEFEVK